MVSSLKHLIDSMSKDPNKKIREIFRSLNYNIKNDEKDRSNWEEEDESIIEKAKILAKKGDFSIYYIELMEESKGAINRISKKLVGDDYGDCLVCFHVLSNKKWIFSGLSNISSNMSQESSSFHDTRKIQATIDGRRSPPKSFIKFFEDIKVESDSRIPALVSQAFDSYAKEINYELTTNVFDALKILTEGIIQENNDLSKNKESIEKIRKPIFILLYRIIFILYAEDKEIFPINKPEYRDKYSLKRIRDNLDNNEYDIQKELKKLFELVEDGDEDGKKGVGMRSYYGSIFDKNIHSELEKYTIKNQVLIDVLKLLTRIKGKKGNSFNLDYSTLETQHIGSIYEGVLEKKVDVIGGKIEKVVDKQERTKSASYFTPKYIVDYIVKETIEPHIETIIKDYPNDEQTQIKKILSLKILDPAMGSGHFLVGVVNYLATRICVIDDGEVIEKKLMERKREVVRRCIFGVDINSLAVDLAKLSLWLETLSSDKPLTFLDTRLKTGNSLMGETLREKGKDNQSRFNIDGRTYNTHDSFRERIGRHYTFEGMRDDDVNLAKTKQKLFTEMTSEHQSYYARMKADLDSKLLKDMGSDFLGEEIMPAEQFCSAEEADTLEKLIKIVTEKGIEKGWAINYDKIIKYRKKYKMFHWELEFPIIFYDRNAKLKENPGFDIIIGNPPYVKDDKDNKTFLALRQIDIGKKYFKGKMDLWYFFTCKSLELLKDNGVHSFIAQNNWITSSGASKLRKKILQDSEIIRWFDFNDFKVFEMAGIQTMIFSLRKQQPNKKYNVECSKITDDDISKEEVENILNGKQSNGYKKWTTEIDLDELKYEKNNEISFFSSDIKQVIKKIKAAGNYYLSESDIGQGIVCPQDAVIEKHLTDLDKSVKKGDGIFIISSDEKEKLDLENEVLKPNYTSKELIRYYGNSDNEYWVIWSDKKIVSNIDKYPKIKKHLDKFRNVITSENKPYGLARARQQRLFEGEKINCLRKTLKPNFTHTDFPCYVTQSYNIIKPQNINLKYLTGILNSSLIYFWLYHKGKKQGEQLQIDSGPLLKLPLISNENSEIIKEVDKIIESYKNNNHHEIRKIEDAIDGIVYDIYNLSDTDKKIIEEFKASAGI